MAGGAPKSGGSSPRVRGTRRRQPKGRDCSTVHPRVCGELARRRVQPLAPIRFIPACAGNSAPTVCPNSRHAGSSPRVRGTPHARRGRRRRHRFIPACAGNSAGPRPAMWTSPVHPRVCGELLAVTERVSASNGSSPRVRGTPARGGRAGVCRRFIPACAGNSLRFAHSGSARPVHPRVCGELP